MQISRFFYGYFEFNCLDCRLLCIKNNLGMDQNDNRKLFWHVIKPFIYKL